MSPAADDRRSCCPLACTLDLLGDRWTLLVIRDLVFGKSRFSEFQRAPEGIATNILADRLSLLVDRGLAERRLAPSGKRVTYHLTEKGRSLRPVLEALREWGLANIEGTAALIGDGKPQG
ncbi:MAG: helix-turn-helix domain-containing protein [Kiloniellaceae bacterium]